MERIVTENKDWWAVRKPERKEYNGMCDALSKNIYRHSARQADKYDYSREADILNIIANGCKAQDEYSGPKWATVRSKSTAIK